MTRIGIAVRTAEYAADVTIDQSVAAVSEVAMVPVESPALELQRRLGEAALRGFYAPTRRTLVFAKRRFAIALGSAAISTVSVFAAILTFYR